MPIKTALLGVVPPVLIALVVLLMAWRPWSAKAPSVRWGGAGSALALALAYAVTDTLVARHWPGFPPSERHRWLPYFGLAAAIGAIIAQSTTWCVAWGVTIAAFVFLRWGQISSRDMFLTGALWAALGSGISASVIGDAWRAGRCGARFALTWMVAAIGASVAFVQASETFFAQMAGVLAAVMGVFAVIALWRPKLELVPGVAPVFACLYLGLALCIGTTMESKGLVMLAALSPAFAGTPLAAKLPRWLATVLCMLIAAALSVAAIWQSPNGFNFSMY
jgi:hypothetical protein